MNSEIQQIFNLLLSPLEANHYLAIHLVKSLEIDFWRDDYWVSDSMGQKVFLYEILLGTWEKFEYCLQLDFDLEIGAEIRSIDIGKFRTKYSKRNNQGEFIIFDDWTQRAEFNFFPATKITEFPNQLLRLKQLRSLSICNQSLQEIPNEIVQLRELESLDLQSNPLQKFPEVLLKLPKLKHLTIPILFGEVPVEITALQGLKSLRIEGVFSELPEEILEMPCLKELELIDANFSTEMENDWRLACEERGIELSLIYLPF